MESPESRNAVKKTMMLIVFTASVIVFLFVIAGKRVPLPDDVVHADALDAGSCLACHSRGGRSPLNPSHPLKEQCLTCHVSWKNCHPVRRSS